MTGADSPHPPVDPDDRRKHLDFIQTVVTRMSAASTTTKSWLLPVVTATYGFALTQKTASVAVLGLGAVLLFAFLDANYLRQERAYRRLYKAVARGTPQIPCFSLDPSDADEPTPEASTSPAAAGVSPVAIKKRRRWEKIMRLARRWVPTDREVWLSWSVTPMYGALLIVGIVTVFLAS